MRQILKIWREFKENVKVVYEKEEKVFKKCKKIFRQDWKKKKKNSKDIWGKRRKNYKYTNVSEGNLM